MAEFLLFQLYGPMASWGEAAAGEVRHTASWPTRSALTGLLGAALGIDRDASEQDRFQSDYRFAMKIVSEGTAMRDYHTVQGSDPGRGRILRNRRQQLAEGQNLWTLLTYRDYRSDARAIVAVQAETGASWSLAIIAASLIRPKYTLYLGRKSCPLALPLQPVLAEQPTIEEALDGYPADRLSISRWIGDRGVRESPVGYCWEPGMPTSMTASFEHDRPDQPISRRRWQFASRREAVHLLAAS